MCARRAYGDHREISMCITGINHGLEVHALTTGLWSIVQRLSSKCMFSFFRAAPREDMIT